MISTTFIISETFIMKPVAPTVKQYNYSQHNSVFNQRCHDYCEKYCESTSVYCESAMMIMNDMEGLIIKFL